jgi:hypothetical protein
LPERLLSLWTWIGASHSIGRNPAPGQALEQGHLLSPQYSMNLSHRRPSRLVFAEHIPLAGLGHTRRFAFGLAAVVYGRLSPCSLRQVFSVPCTKA